MDAPMPQRVVRFLSKSRLGDFKQCPKKLWLQLHCPELRADSASTRSAFAVGDRVGELARCEHPDGVLIGHQNNLSLAIRDTQTALLRNPRVPIFEATVEASGVLIRADVLRPTGGGWHLAEVKSTGQVKDAHLPDLAVQTWVLRAAGVDVVTVELRHLDKTFVYPGGGRFAGLLRAGALQRGTVHDAIERLQAEVPQWIADAMATANGDVPDVGIGPQCSRPYPCPFFAHCSRDTPASPEYPVGLLPGKRGKALARRLEVEGFADLRDVPADRFDDPTLQRVHLATVSGAAWLDTAGARAAVASWAHPRAFLDFETIATAIPVWEGTRPFQPMPFQWSAHIEDAPGVFRWLEFLDLTGTDPSRACAEALVRTLLECPCIVAYSASTERSVVRRLAEAFEDLSEPLLRIADRIVDLLPIVAHHYYHPDMHGSTSLKPVLKTLAPDIGHAHLEEVQDGRAAQEAYLEAVKPDTPSERREQLRERLSTYCALDTWAMVVVLARVTGEIEPER